MRFILWLGASFGYLCLAELVEFRYFGPPFLLLCFEIENRNFSVDVEGVHKEESRWTKKEKMVWTTVLKALINATVLGIFIFYQFDGKYGSGRFMW